MKRTVRQSVCDELRNKYEEVDLEEVFDIPHMYHDSLSRWDLGQKIGKKALSVNQPLSKLKSNKFVNPLGEIKAEYHKEINVSLDNFIEDCVECGILQEVSRGRFELVNADPTLFKSERDGISIECRWEEPYTVYRHRMNTSGEIDVKANGDPAIDGRTLQDPLAW